MNTKNNKRSQHSISAIKAAFLNLAHNHPNKTITVQSICSLANVNRTTFYAHYLNIFDLSEQIQQEMNTQISEILMQELQRNTQDIPRAFENVFKFVGENQDFYRTRLNHATHPAMINIVDQQTLLDYFAQVGEQMGYPHEQVGYHVSFFINGLSGILRYWLRRDCKESPAVMAQIVQAESPLRLLVNP